MNRMSRTEPLKVIRNKFKEYKRQGGQDGIDEKIQEVERELKEHLKNTEKTMKNKLKIKNDKKIKKI